MDGISFDVMHLHSDDTGFDGVFQLQTRSRSGNIKYYPNLIELDKYLAYSISEYRIVHNTANLSPDHRDMVIYYILKHFKYILKFWCIGKDLNSSERLELYTNFQPITYQEMLSHKE